MQHTAIIRKMYLTPMVEVVPSKLQITVFVPTLREEVRLQDEVDGLKGLIEKFNFEVIDDGWDFSGLIGQQCIISERSGNYYFDHF